MSFFIPGRTTCAICTRGIEHRSQAARLPVVDPAQAPHLAPHARRYVHRDCWETWSEQDAYRTAAVAVLARPAGQDAVMMPTIGGPGLVWFEVPSLRGFRIEDLDLLTTFVLSRSDTCRVANWLRRVMAGAMSEVLTVGAETWKIGAPDQLVRSQDGQPIEVVRLPSGALPRWETLFQKLCSGHIASEEPSGVTTSDEGTGNLTVGR